MPMIAFWLSIFREHQQKLCYLCYYCYKQFTLILFKLTLLGFISKNIKEMRTLLQKLDIDDYYVIKLAILDLLYKK